MDSFGEHLPGWTRAQTERERWEHVQPDGIVIAVEKRDEASPIWLWIIQGGEKRCIGLTPTSDEASLLARIVEKQDQLTLMSYLMAGNDFGGVATTTIVAWEQFGP